MATSVTKIYNLALLRMGQAAITDITEDSKAARVCNQIYDQVLDEALAEGPEQGWKFARARVDGVGVDATAPAFEYDYRFAVPDNCIRVTSVSVDGTEITDWIREGDYILTNEESTDVEIRYIQRITDVAKFPPHFVNVLKLKLALELIFNLTQDAKLAQIIQYELDNKALPRAMAIDEKEKYVQEFNNDWQDAGRSGD